eukprot:jgi/Mesvir1/15302/Mv06511-RA.1
MEPFIIFLGFVIFYHVSEGALAFIYNRDDFSMGSFLFSREYLIAMGCACLEYWLERAFCPGLKSGAMCSICSITGILMVVTGELMRKTAMITARRNFTHSIKHTRRADHRLVTEGIYRYIRHPGYLGWFIWSVGTQVLLCNPICIPAFTYVSWSFFATRIPYPSCPCYTPFIPKSFLPSLHLPRRIYLVSYIVFLVFSLCMHFYLFPMSNIQYRSCPHCPYVLAVLFPFVLVILCAHIAYSSCCV